MVEETVEPPETLDVPGTNAEAQDIAATEERSTQSEILEQKKEEEDKAEEDKAEVSGPRKIDTLKPDTSVAVTSKASEGDSLQALAKQITKNLEAAEIRMDAYIPSPSKIILRDKMVPYTFARIIQSGEKFELELLCNIPTRAHEEVLQAIKGLDVVVTSRVYLHPSGLS